MAQETLGRAGGGLLSKQFHDLGLRVASGLVLAALALALTYFGGLAFTALVMAVAAAMSWEWGRIVRSTGFDVAGLLHMTCVVLATALAAAGQLPLAGIALLAGALAMLPLVWGRATVLSCLGVFYVGMPAVALIILRADATHGLAAVLFVMLVVWTVDTGAFLGGRSIGGRRLWPAISPNKTWAGFICGVGAGVAMGAGLALWIAAPVLHLMVVSLVLGAVSQAGDLAESALKREFGVKDSSALIPGHGGFLDRLDGVAAAAAVAGVVGLLANVASPAKALLFGV